MGKYFLKKLRNQIRFGWLRWGDFNSVSPINKSWGFNRGKPIDRFYIEKFIELNSGLIKGNVLSVGDDYYAKKYGGSLLKESNILNLYPTDNSTIVADLADANEVDSNQFDCFLLIQTLQLIYDLDSAVETAYRILKPGGYLLVTVPGITPLKDEEWNESWFWNLTLLSAKRLFETHFKAENLTIEVHGNALAATAFLHGLAVEDVGVSKLQYADSGFPVTITVRGKKESS